MREMEVSEGLVDASELCISMKMDDPLPPSLTLHPVSVTPSIESAASSEREREMAPPFDAAQRVNREAAIESVFDETRIPETAAPSPVLHFRSDTLQLFMIAEAPDWIEMAGALMMIGVPDAEDA